MVRMNPDQTDIHPMFIESAGYQSDVGPSSYMVIDILQKLLTYCNRFRVPSCKLRDTKDGGHCASSHVRLTLQIPIIYIHAPLTVTL